jgi:adenine-specific DNA-methyltransferase
MSEITNERELLNRIEQLQRELEISNNRIKKTKYGLVWMEVPEAFESETENQLPILEEIKEKSIDNEDDKPTHLLIEGDNYHSLTCLNYTHKNRIDLIYIDPPYNTGSDGFKYKDKRVLDKFPDGTDVPKDHPLRHSYWLSFMFKRLELAYNLLKEEGVLFISINEEEYAQLKLLCDRIFQESNYLTTFTVKVRHEDRILKGDKDFHETTEQLLLYRKSSKFKTIKRLQDNTSIDKYVFEVEELIDNPEIINFGSKPVQVFKPNEYRIIKGEPSSEKFQKINIRGSIKEGNSSGRFHMKYLESRNNLLGYLYKVPDMGDDNVPYRYFLTREKTTLANGSYFQGVPKSRNDIKEVPYPNYLDFEETFNNVGNEGGIIFRNGKKPVDFLKFIFSIGTRNKNAIILDFFAGSGSTGHAVLEQNSIDGGKRQFILCTNNENNISHEITHPRLNNVINGYSQSQNQKEILFELPLNPKTLKDNTAILDAVNNFFSDQFKERYDEIKDEVRKDKYTIYGIIKKDNSVKGFGNSLKYYKTSFVGKNNILSASDEDKALLALKAGYLLAIAENTLVELETTNHYQFFENKEKITAIYFKEELNEMETFINKVEVCNKPISLYLFSWGNKSDFEGMFDHIPNLRIKTIPQPILEIYKNIYNLITV